MPKQDLPEKALPESDLPEEVADAVWYAINQRDGLVVTDLVVKPQLHRIKRKR